MSNRQLKKMFGNDILYALKNYYWRQTWSKYGWYSCDKKIVTENFNIDMRIEANLLYKEVKIILYGLKYKKELKIKFGVFSKVYWQIVCLENENFKRNIHVKRNRKANEYSNVVRASKELNRHHTEKEIAKIQQTIDNLTKIEKEYFKRLEK